MRKEEDEDQRVRNLFREITKLLPERSKIKTDLLYFKYAPILVMLFRWYSVSQFYDSKMEITLWYEENEEPIWFFYFITYILYPISLWKGQVLHRLCVEWRIPLLYAAGVNVIHIMFGSIVITNNMYYCDICEQDGINMLSEEPCYMMGSLCEEPCYMMGSLCEGFFKMYC